MSKIYNTKGAIRLPLLISAAIVVGALIGAQMNTSSDVGPDVYKKSAKLKQVLTFIENDYVDEVDTEEMVDDAIVSMLEKLDPHSNYLTAEDLHYTQSQLEGNFEGIGIEFNIFKDTIHVIAPLSGGPSEKLGILPGDKIITVDGRAVAGIGITQRDVVQTLRGPKGSEVLVGIKRRGSQELLEFQIVRDVIPEFSVDVSYMIDEKTGYIKVSRFAATTYMEFVAAIDQLREEGMTQLVLDLTGNAGGYMTPAVEMADEFLEDNKMIVYTEGKESMYDSKHVSQRKGNFEEGSLIVLIDEGSASASEIVSGAIQDHDRGLIVGRRSYGKGLVQVQYSLNDGSGLKLTVSRYYTPSGRSIQKPYNGSLAEYQREHMNRFSNGEAYNEDSIKVNESLEFKTTNGRTVYGGGGIVPDYFVAYDTTENSGYLNRLLMTNSIREFALQYSQDNAGKFASMEVKKFLEDFMINDAMLDQIIRIGESNGLPFDEEGFSISKNQIQMYAKAFIGRGIWDAEGFYPVINAENDILQKALTLFDEANTLLVN